MRNHRLLFIIFVLSSCIVTASTVLAVIPLKLALVFEPVRSSAKMTYVPMEEDSKFAIKYTHSIHLSDVLESYRVASGHEIQQNELEFEDFSIGMPANAEKGEKFEQVNGKYQISNMKRNFPFFYLRVGQVRANHRLIFQNKEYPLANWIEPGASVKVVIRRLTLLELWKGVNILE